MRIPTTSTIEAALRVFGMNILVSSPTVILGFCHEWLLSFLPQMTNLEQAKLIVWLGLSTLLLASFFLFYFYNYRVTKKALLTVKPDYYTEQLNDRLWEQVTNDRAREKNKP